MFQYAVKAAEMIYSFKDIVYFCGFYTNRSCIIDILGLFMGERASR